MNYTLEIEIDQPKAKIAELFGNPDNLAYWQPGFQSCEPLESPAGEPRQYRMLYKHGKRDIEMHETVIADDLPDKYTARYKAPGMVMHIENVFEELSSNKTRWVSHNTATVSGFFMRLMTFIMPGCFKKQSFLYMKHFKAFAEEGTDVRETEKA